jgi:AraC-like DNA-binding protein
MDRTSRFEGWEEFEELERGLLESWPGVRTSSPEDMRGFLLAGGDAGRFEVVDRAEPFLGQINFARLSQIGLGFAQFSSGIELELPPLGGFSQHFCLRGQGELVVSGAAVPLSDTVTGVTGPDIGIRARTDPGYRGLALLVTPHALNQKIEALLGFRPDGEIEFIPRVSLADPFARHLQHSILFLAQELDAAGTSSSNMAFREFEEYLLLLFLRANRHNFSDLIQALQTRSAAPWQVKLTEDYLEANWTKRITIEDIAATAGVSARSIFKAFKQSRGYSPMSFLKELRLKKAREMLQRAERGATVAGIAERCGFLSLGHFARDYEKRFGERPSVTLRGAWGRR